ncbi:MAG: metallophosphoesterase [Nanoarchaeota archaeon]
MDTKEVLAFCLRQGLLIDKETLNLISETTDIDSAKLIIEKIKEHTNSRIITKNIFYQHKGKIDDFFSLIPEDKIENFKKLKIELGLSIEISRQEAKSLAISSKLGQTKEIKKNSDGIIEILANSQGFQSKETGSHFTNEMPEETMNLEENEEPFVKIVSTHPMMSKKIDVGDFVNHFRNRFIEIRGFLQERPELTNLVSINKISGNKQGISIIGIVSDKKITKNKNIFFDVEDLTGKIRVIVGQNKKESYEKAENICLDSVIGFRGSGSREVFFANEIILPDAALLEKKHSLIEEYALFISDIHVGSRLFLEKNFLNFIDYLNGKIPNTPEYEKIKYLFVVGDLVAGIGVYPNQEKDLLIKDIEGQYARFAELIGKIRSDIKIIILPGNHDCVRLAEPQPILDEKYAWPIYNLKNVTLVSNPSMINIGARKNFQGFDVLAYHGFSYFYYAGTVPKLIAQDSANSPDKIMTYLLQHRHLAPTHASVQYVPSEKDPLLIRRIPDIFVSGHTHTGTVSNYNNILIISNSCWEDLTPIQEKFGSKPNFCKVPMFNLKTRAIRMLDFEDDEHKGKMSKKMGAK